MSCCGKFIQPVSPPRICFFRRYTWRIRPQLDIIPGENLVHTVENPVENVKNPCAAQARPFPRPGENPFMSTCFFTVRIFFSQPGSPRANHSPYILAGAIPKTLARRRRGSRGAVSFPASGFLAPDTREACCSAGTFRGRKQNRFAAREGRRQEAEGATRPPQA